MYSGTLDAAIGGRRGRPCPQAYATAGRHRKRRGAAMRVLVVGSGGREHALCWAIAASPLLTKLWCAPGNPGHRRRSRRCVPIGAMDFAALVAFARDNEIDLVVPGPEAPLVAGITDAMEAAGDRLLRPERGRRAAGRQQDLHQGGLPTPPASPPRYGSASTTPRPPANSSAAAARRSWSRRMGSPPARAWWSPPPRPRRWPPSTP